MLPLLLVNVDHKIHLVLPYSNLKEDVSCYKNPKGLDNFITNQKVLKLRYDWVKQVL